MKLGKSGVRAGLGWIVVALAMLAVFFLAACGSAATPVPPAATAILPEPTGPLPQATATAPPATATMPPAAAATVEATDSPLAAAFPLSEPGPYYSGRRKFVAQDASRGGKQVSITVWYPALLPEGTAGSRLRKLFIRPDKTCCGMSASSGSGIWLSAIRSRIRTALLPTGIIVFTVCSACSSSPSAI